MSTVEATPADPGEAPKNEPTSATPEVFDAAYVQKLRDEAAKYRTRAQANADAAKELDALKQSAMSETEKAVATAKAEGRAEALREVGTARVDDAFRVAAAGRHVDIDALLEGLDKTRFVSDEGEPNRAAIAAWIDRIAPQQDEQAQLLDLGQGVRTGSSMALNGDPLLRDLKSKLGC